MGKAKGLTTQVIGKTKEALGEIVGDQDLHEEGKEDSRKGREERGEPSKLNPLRRLNQLT